MTRTGTLPPETTFEEVKLKIRESYANPNTGRVFQVVVKDGPRAFKIATVIEIVDPSTGDFHHHHLRLDHIDKRKGGWFAKPEKSFSAEDTEIATLCTFLRSVVEEDLTGAAGDLHIIRSDDYESLADVVGSLDNLAAHDRLEFAKAVLTKFSGPGPSLDEFAATFESTNADVLSTIADASRLVEYRAALDEFRELVEANCSNEQQIQDHLAQHPWIFGSEYSELLERRKWTRDENLDFMLRRTVDGYLEIVEIKTPALAPLFRYDSSHDCHYVASGLSKVIGQVLNYVHEVELQRNAILANDGEETLKVRARIIAGRDGTEEETMALRKLNSHLSNIEVFTFDQLVRIGERVVKVFERTGASEEAEDSDIPF